MEARCCRFVIGSVVRVPSPFRRILATGYYDGPTDGLVECATCSTLYQFQKLDWDDQQDMRIFALSPIPGHSFAELEVTRSGSEGPAWPIWVPADQVTQELALRVDAILDAASPAEFIVATENLLGIIDVWRPIGLRVPVDWFAELGLERVRVE
jgi:hypothetical protein